MNQTLGRVPAARQPGAGRRRCGAGRAARKPHLAAWQAGGVIVGIGVDLVDIARLEQALRRTPALAARLFTESERAAQAASLAACFAAKEAVAKALGAPAGPALGRCGGRARSSGPAALTVRGTVADAAHRLGVRRWHVSLTHDGDVSVACVVAEG